VGLGSALVFLLEEGVDGVLLEGGPRLTGAFLQRRLVDKLALFLAPRFLGEGRGLAEGFGVERVAEALRLRLSRREWLGEDLWLEAYLED
jgi:diaminohydroxyphosphoribosylaminopyrimidine deaminase/5-amino-6-(5-phosphoribosylamino)uracil reductase